MTKSFILGALGLAVLLALGWNAFIEAPEQRAATTGGIGDALVAVSLPDALTGKQQIGARAFETNCATCHGVNAAGRDGIGPPLVHIIYEPSHHGDQSFHLAVMNGVRSHHWPYGNMPPVDGLTTGDVDMIVDYVRALQRSNGIN